MLLYFSLECKNDAVPRKKVKSFANFKSFKGKQWKSRVSKKFENNDESVVITIGLLEWSEKSLNLRPKRGKRLALRVQKSDNAHNILLKAEDKWKSYNSECFKDSANYMLTYESGKEVLFLPGTYDPFVLHKYKEEIDKDYKRIVLYLCTRADHMISEKELAIEEDVEYDSDSVSNAVPEKLELCDEETDFNEVAREWDINPWDSFPVEQEKVQPPITNAVSAVEKSNSGIVSDKCIISATISNISDVYEALKSRINKSQQFFLVTRRGIALSRILKLWQRQTSKDSPTGNLAIKYNGEEGIDTGALSKEFLADTIHLISQEMFPDGSPLNSTLHVQNGNFRTCGEIVAVSLAQGGPPPSFLAQCAYELIYKEVDMTDIIDSNLTVTERELIDRIQNNCEDQTDIILENGYTGVINEQHLNEIIRSVKVSIVGKRLLYLKEFSKGLDLYGLREMICNFPTVLKELFVKEFAFNAIPDANYLFSLMKANYTDEGSNRMIVEEHMMDYLQDTLLAIEDSDIAAEKTAVAWNHFNESDEDEAADQEEQFITRNISIPNVMGWLTGQRHKATDNYNDLAINVKFDHNCLIHNPDHSLCFPVVNACIREVLFPVAHMNSEERFRKVFVMAFSKGDTFGRH